MSSGSWHKQGPKNALLQLVAGSIVASAGFLLWLAYDFVVLPAARCRIIGPEVGEPLRALRPLLLVFFAAVAFIGVTVTAFGCVGVLRHRRHTDRRLWDRPGSVRFGVSADRDLRAERASALLGSERRRPSPAPRQ